MENPVYARQLPELMFISPKTERKNEFILQKVGRFEV